MLGIRDFCKIATAPTVAPLPQPHRSYGAFDSLGCKDLRKKSGVVMRNRPFSFQTVSAVLLSMVLLILVPRLFAQSFASASGTVTDSTEAVIVEARVEITNTSTNVTKVATTNNTGNYSFVSVAPGTYSITVSKLGFQTKTENNIILGVNQAAVYNFSIPPGQVKQSITVTSETSTVQTSTAELGTVVNTTAVSNLPLNGRNFTELLELTPGVSRISVAQNKSSGVDNNPIGQFTFPSVNGQSNRSNMFYLDGSNDLGTYKGNYTYEPIVDDI